MSWQYSLSTFVWIFPVGRGNAAFVRTGLNQGFVLDMGVGTDCNPAEFVEQYFVPNLDRYKKNKIAQAILSHPHSDHIAQCELLGTKENSAKLYPTLLTCPNDRNLEGEIESGEKVNWKRITNQPGTEHLLESYRATYTARRPPLQTIQFEAQRTIPHLEYGIFYIRPPKCEVLHPTNDNEYGNSLSIMLYLRHGTNSILFPGDMTPEGMEHIVVQREGTEKRFTVFNREFAQSHSEWHVRTLDQPPLKWLLTNYGLSILVAPHHGLESCFPPALYGAIKGGKPQLVVISERRHKNENDGTVDGRYQSREGAAGLNVNREGTTEERRSVSTVDGHHILIVFSGNGAPSVFLDRDPKRLLSKLPG